jgi:predicted MFS family arabinose efflux permease
VEATVRVASPRVEVAVGLLGIAAAWNAGNVGPVVDQIASDFDVSLTVVGLLSGTFWLGATVIGLLFAARVGERLGLARGLRVTCVLLVVGALVFALTPVFAGLVIGRVLPGIGLAWANTLGAVWAREVGGVRLLGIFGASIQLGAALALLVGSGLNDLGVGWRVGFAITAALGVAAYLAIPREVGVTLAPRGAGKGFLRAAATHLRVYRLALLFIAIYGVPLILATWMIEYLVLEADVATSLAGTISFLLFAASAATRVLGARIQERGASHAVLAGSLGLAGLGLLAVTLRPSAAVAVGAVLLIAIGVGIPYATALSEAQDLYPDEPSEPMALMTLVALAPPAAVTPLVGRALDTGHGEAAFGALAVFVLVAAAANIRPSGIPLTAPAPEGC